MAEGRRVLWVFDRPLARDWVVWATVVGPLVVGVGDGLGQGSVQAFAFGLVWGAVLTALVLGSGRNLVRGFREPRHGAED
jgi:hypothetical protein